MASGGAGLCVAVLHGVYSPWVPAPRCGGSPSAGRAARAVSDHHACVGVSTARTRGLRGVLGSRLLRRTQLRPTLSPRSPHSSEDSGPPGDSCVPALCVGPGRPASVAVKVPGSSGGGFRGSDPGSVAPRVSFVDRVPLRASLLHLSGGGTPTRFASVARTEGRLVPERVTHGHTYRVPSAAPRAEGTGRLRRGLGRRAVWGPAGAGGSARCSANAGAPPRVWPGQGLVSASGGRLKGRGGGSEPRP